MFNKKLKKKISDLEAQLKARADECSLLADTVTKQRLLLSEKESELYNIQSKFHYNEGQFAMMNNLIDSLRQQVKSQTERAESLQRAFLVQNVISHDKLTETVTGMFEEDEKEIKKIYDESGVRVGDEGELG